MSFRDFSKTHPDTDKTTQNKPLDGAAVDTPSTQPDQSAAEKEPAPKAHQGAND